MKINLNQLDRYIYKKYGGQFKQVYLFDKSLLSGFSLSGGMVVTKSNAVMIARAFVAVAPFMTHPDLEFDNPSK